MSPGGAQLPQTGNRVLSSGVYLLFPPLLMQLTQSYGRHVNRGIHIVWALMIVVGLSSAYFHATLSLVGQLLDELAILWLVLAAAAIWFPSPLRPPFLRKEAGGENLFRVAVVTFAMLSSLLAFAHPFLNAFVLMLLVIPGTGVLIWELKRCESRRAVKLGIRSMAVFFAAVFCWVVDRVFCDVWMRLQIPYFHGAWHVLAFIGCYSSCMLFAYFDAMRVTPERNPSLVYWPINSFELGVPYIRLSSGSHHSGDNKINKIL